ncbi:hypothetical protein D6833_04690 [Candidatus Parcubacteria bacterium]|nr:MAG: hypothetical protein D6833_04690 [Candidatus Parcubacteria bacterium]
MALDSREAHDTWPSILRDLTARGLKALLPVHADGRRSLRKALREVRSGLPPAVSDPQAVQHPGQDVTGYASVVQTAHPAGGCRGHERARGHLAAMAYLEQDLEASWCI